LVLSTAAYGLDWALNILETAVFDGACGGFNAAGIVFLKP
jgi:hypothetical protein